MLLWLQALADVCHLYSNTIESPCFQSQKNGTDYSIRYYGPAPEVREGRIWPS
jgi:hypothetical protein